MYYTRQLEDDKNDGAYLDKPWAKDVTNLLILKHLL